MRVFLILCLVVVVRENSAEIDWWETSVIYQIFPRSFRDSDGDGIGDLKGIIEKLDYIKDLGVDAIWIQPVYRSPMVDMGYDIISFREIDPIFGTMEDMKNLIREAHKMDLLVVMDFVVNHVSDQSEWFQRSVKREEPYTDYFIWHGGKEINETLKVEPNNWASFFSPSAWKWNENRKEYYFHQFSEHQPDLNLRNVKVRYEIEEVLRFWLDLGVDGFRVDAIAYLFEAAHLLDEPVINSHRDGFRWFALDHIYTVHQPENLDILHRWREILDGYAKLDNKTRLLSVEDVFSAKHLIPYFGNETFSMAHIPFYFTLVYQDHTANATKLDYIIHDFFDRVPKNHLPNMMLESHDYYRVSTRFGADAVDAFNMLRLLLPGSTCIYYGGEIGLEDSMIRNDQRTDFLNPQYDSRDKCRGPMPWDDTNNGGFTTNKKPWVPLSSKYWFVNVKRQLEESHSHLKNFKRLMALRKSPIIKYGDLTTNVVNTWTYSFSRNRNNDTIVVVINLGSESEKICSDGSNFGLPETMFVHTGSLNSGFKTGDEVRIKSSEDQSCPELRPKAGLVLTTHPSSAVMVLNSALWLFFLTIGMSFLWQAGFY